MTKSYRNPSFPTKAILLIGLLLAALSTTVPALAQSNNTIFMAARAGYDGYYRQNAWIPVTVSVANDGPAIEGEIAIEMGTALSNDRQLYTAPISLPTQSNKQVTLYVYISRFTSDLEVQLRDGDGNTVTVVRTNSLSLLSSDDLLYAVITDTPGEMGYLENVTGTRSGAAVAYINLADLPAAAAAWQMLDVLILNNVDTSILSSVQLGNLQSWLDLGGQLVVTGGSDWQPTSAAVADLLPVAITGVETVADLPALVADMGIPFRDPGPYLVADSSLTSGELLLHQDGLPLLARRDVGKGAAYFLALDPNLAPLLDWDGSEGLWARVADNLPRLPAWASGVQNGWTAVSAISRLPALTLPSVLQLVFFLLVYTAVMGPGTYIVLKRRNRLELAWAIIPLLVVVFTAVSYVTGFQLRGNNTIINQMSVVYGEVGSDTMRVQTLVGLYSPRRTSYDLSVGGDKLIRPFTNDFSNGQTNINAIRYGLETTLDNIRLDIGEVGTFISNHTGQTPDITGTVTMYSSEGNLAVDVTVTNNSASELTPATMLVAGNAIALGNIAPGQTVTKSANLGIAAPTTSPTGAVPIFVPGSVAGAPLTSNATAILGSSDYYDDRELYPRWELLQAIESNPNGGGIVTMPTDAATLIAWTNAPQLDVTLSTNDDVSQNNTTLYLLELPFSRDLVRAGDVVLPAGLLNWRTVEQVNVYDASIFNFYLSNGRVAFEYTPWPEFQEMAVSDITIVLNSSDASYTAAPTISLWNWQTEAWDPLADGDWGNTAVPTTASYLSSTNTIRIQLESGTGTSGAYINEIYPQLTGTISE